MDLRELRCLLAVADEGSFTAAARKLHMTQPSLSYVIRQLETEVGARVFERLPRGARLTAVGEAMIEPARLALHHEERARVAAIAVTGLITGRLRLAVVRIAVSRATRTVAEFARRYPSVLVSIDEPSGDPEVIDMVRTGRAELGICRTGGTSDLDSTSLGWQEVVAVFADHRAPDARPLHLRDLATVPLIVPMSGTPERRAVDDAFAAAGVAPIVAVESTQQTATLDLVREGVGAALMPFEVAEQACPTGITYRRFGARVGSDLYVVRRRGDLSPAGRAFSDLLDELSRTADLER